jgi:DNA-binding LacI/PurR family transcriptional regulator
LAGRSSSTIGVLIGAYTAHVYYTQLAELERHAFEARKQLSAGLIQNQSQVAPYLADFRSYGIDTLICMIHELPGDNDTIPGLVADFDRVIYLGKPAGVVDPLMVEVDFADGAKQTVEHLKSQGRQRIGLAVSSRSGHTHAARSKAFAKSIRKFSPLKP